MSRRNIRKENFFNKYRNILVCLFLIISTLSVYWQVTNYNFVDFDDIEYVYENRHIQDGFTLDSIKWAFTTNRASIWHPLSWLSHMLDYQLYGLNPGGHHLTNLLFHILNTLLLFFVLKKMTGHLWQSAFVAALFALHPLHVESVAWISERKDVLSTFFWMLTMWSYIRYVRDLGIYNYLLVLLFFILGLMAKPMLVTLPFVLLLLDYYPLHRFKTQSNRINSKQRSKAFHPVLEKIPFFIFVVISGVIALYAQKHGGSVASLEAITIQTRIANALVSYVNYLIKMIYPYGLTVIYPYPASFPWWQITGALFILLSVSFLAVKRIKQSPYLIVGWLWYLGTLVPVIGLVQVGDQSMADRYTYIPLIGIFIIISWGIPDFVKRWQHKKILLSATAAVILVASMTITYVQAGYWENSTTLFKHALNVTSNNYTAHNNYGRLIMINNGKAEEAMPHFNKALNINPRSVEALNNIGVILAGKGKLDEAVSHFSRALSIRPNDVETHFNLGLALTQQGKIDNAIKHYEEALRIEPENEKAHINLALALQAQGRMDKAIEHYREALRINPFDEKVHNSLGVALAYRGDITEAIKYFRAAVKINPNYGEAKNNLNEVLTYLKMENN
jgi:protein O-mannosyl-transferase